MLKTISYNVLVFFVLANVLYWSIPVVGSISSLIKGKHENSLFEFRSFLGWRNPQRPTVNDATAGDRKVYFFGGSTMWGFWSSEAANHPLAVCRRHQGPFGELRRDRLHRAPEPGAAAAIAAGRPPAFAGHLL